MKQTTEDTEHTEEGILRLTSQGAMGTAGRGERRKGFSPRWLSGSAGILAGEKCASECEHAGRDAGAPTGGTDRRFWFCLPLPCGPCLPWFLLLFLAASTSAAEFRVGFASADITPPVGWRRAGNYTELISTGVNDPLMTKAMVVQEGATTFAFVGNDLCSVPRDLTDLARLQADAPAPFASAPDGCAGGCG